VCSTGFQECTAAGSVAPKCNLTTSQVGDCTNVNECSDGNNGGCGTETYNLCVDTAGSSHCDCADGWTMQKDDQGVNKCVNINECEEKDNACPDPKSTCKDTEGSYNCPCSDGWKEDNQQCVDINECADPDYPYDCPNKLQSVCRNTVGGFECDCDVGTMWNTTTNGCTDLNECETQDIKCGGADTRARATASMKATEKRASCARQTAAGGMTKGPRRARSRQTEIAPK
jgi:hypothetical protein